MGKYIVEVIVLGLLALMLAPFIMGAVNVLRKKYFKMFNDTTKEIK